jgi:hypothetical protein
VLTTEGNEELLQPVALGRVILDFVLAPANVTDLVVGFEMLSEHTDLKVLGDKAYISASKAAELWRTNRLRLQTLPGRNQKRQLPREVKHLFNSVCQVIETVNDQLSEQLHIETNHAHSFWGLCTRLLTELTAHTLPICVNRLLGKTGLLADQGPCLPDLA